MTDDRDTTFGLRDLAGEYEILGELGRGGTAVVYRARDRELGRDVAIKVVHGRFAGDEETLARLAREARTVARLDHPNIVAMHSVRRLGDGSLALIMQYVPGRTLKQAILQEAPFSPERTEAILREVAAALSHAHHNGVVHRDVKPENIFLHEETGRVLLADFGTARSLDGDSRVTMEGAAIGTPTYMSPEQIDGAALDGRTDLYSLALVGWEMLTGEAPWEGETLYNVILKQKNERLPPLKRLRPDVPARLWFALEWALRKSPAARPSSAEAFVAELDDASPAARWRRLRASLLVPGGVFRREPRVDSRQEVSETIRYVRLTEDESQSHAPPVVPLRTDGWATQRRAAVAALVLLGGSAALVSALSLRSAGAEAEPDPQHAAVALAAPPVPEEVSLPPAATVPGDTVAAAAGADTVVEVPDSAAGAGSQPAVPAQSGRSPAPEASSGETAASLPSSSPTATAPRGQPEQPARDAPPVRPVSRARLVAAGGTHTCRLDPDGTAACWGGNDRGQLGATAGGRASQPVRLDGLRFASLAAGVSHTCGITGGGDAFCWGANESGQLGGASGPGGAPVRVSGGESFSVLAAGMSHTCGITRTGSLLCWGDNSRGQLGDGGTESRATPGPVEGGPFRALAVGWNHSCAANRDGKVYCWGDNAHGQLGRGHSAQGRSPVPAAGSEWFVSVTAGSAHTCALTGGGRAYCWGQNSYGQLGDGGKARRDRPHPVAGRTAFASISAGGVHTCALTGDGQAFCWGRNSYGQLGDGTTTTRMAPTRVQGRHRFAQIEASGAHTCGVTTAGENLCWGYNVEGQLGDGSRSHRTTPVGVRASKSE